MFTFDLNAISSRSKKGETVAEYLKNRESVKKYVDIMVHVDPLDPIFQNDFNDYYGLNAALGMNKAKFYDVFHDFYNHLKYVSYRNILEALKSSSTGTGRVEASFGSKILHTIDGDEPIIDHEVIEKLRSCFCTRRCFLEIPKTITGIDTAVDLHNALTACYVKYLIPYAKTVDYFNKFDAAFPQAKHISDVKKIDFYLWAM